MLALEEIEGTVDRATELANQMLALAKVEQLREQPRECLAWDAVVREVSLDLAPLIADKDLDFVLEADTPSWSGPCLDAARAGAQSAAQRCTPCASAQQPAHQAITECTAAGTAVYR